MHAHSRPAAVVVHRRNNSCRRYVLQIGLGCLIIGRGNGGSSRMRHMSCHVEQRHRTAERTSSGPPPPPRSGSRLGSRLDSRLARRTSSRAAHDRSHLARSTTRVSVYHGHGHTRRHAPIDKTLSARATQTSTQLHVLARRAGSLSTSGSRGEPAQQEHSMLAPHVASGDAGMLDSGASPASTRGKWQCR